LNLTTSTPFSHSGISPEKLSLTEQEKAAGFVVESLIRIKFLIARWPFVPVRRRGKTIGVV
jgi:hypothetical protein